MKKYFLIPFILFVVSNSIGCSSLAKKWKNLTSEESSEEKKSNKPIGISFNQQNNLSSNVHRKYKRTTKKDIESGAQLDSKAGSLWVMEGQGAYLFSQNIVRMIGDPIAVQIDGDPLAQLTSKADVIQTLLKQIEERRKRLAGRNLAGEKGKDKAESVTPTPTAPPAAATAPTAPGGAPAESTFAVKQVPTRVVERLVDGNYRVRGMQAFMIGSREYKVIVSGIVRSEDFNDNGISAAQLLDSNFDIVSTRGAELK
jgi:flagellar L-ring protein precursor FlgH